jgi:hypothetical protein
MARRGLSGTADNPDLELRLQRVENKLANATGFTAGSTDAESISTDNELTPGYITGVYVTASVPGVITLRWEPLDQNRVQRYEIYVSQDKTFSDPARLKTYSVSNKANSFNFADPDDDPQSVDPAYYFKIRAVSSSGRAGPWGVVVNSQTGKATALHLGFGTDVIEDSQTWAKPPYVLESYYPNSKYDPFSLSVGNVQVEISEPSALLCVGLLNVQFELWAWSRVTAEMVVRTNTNAELDNDGKFGKVVRSIRQSWTMDGVYPLYMVDVFDPPKAGIYTFSLKLTLDWDVIFMPPESTWGWNAYGGFYTNVSAGRVVSDYRNFPRRMGILGYKMSVAKLI